MLKPRRIDWLLPSLVLALLFTACGKAGSSISATGGSTSGSAPAVQKTATVTTSQPTTSTAQATTATTAAPSLKTGTTAQKTTPGTSKRTTTTQKSTTSKKKTTAQKKNSVYGKNLSDAEYSAVIAKAKEVVAQVIRPGMSERQKLDALAVWLIDHVRYEGWEVNRGNTAWGPLIKGTGACSGYARAYKLLCDTQGSLDCYFVHAAKDAYNPEHQFNVVRCDGKYYIADVQCMDSSFGELPDNWLAGSLNQPGDVYRYSTADAPAVVAEQNYFVVPLY
ncbi:MAG: hypothetical protein LBQ33_02090 [Oscillospiraceae bacterium]|nr:hypothetical protein [Oscillospiraceae bacterium]